MKAFTLVEIMLVVAILGLLITIGVPGFLTARNKGRLNTETANLKAIADNITAYGVNEGKVADIIDRLWPSLPHVANESSYIRLQLSCPLSNVAYSIDTASQLGSCSRHGVNPTEASLQN